MNLPILINTRPQHRGDAIRQMADMQVLDLPLLEIVSLSITQDEQEMMKSWLAGDHAALVIASVEAARRAVAWLDKAAHWQTTQQSPIIAVGAATAKVLTARGLSVILPQTANNEGMLALPQIDALTAGDRLLIWRGVGGRRLLHDTLVARGVQVDAVCWYERRVPKDLPQAFAQLQLYDNKQPIYVIISSQMAFESWCSLPQLNCVHYLALGERLCRLVKTAKPASAVSQIDTLNPDDIRRAIGRTLAVVH
ncbi:uroporphyrinogen-III synthase [Moraxella marmotae]|uniref:uroporphyrinogen-III synthase n=1 Tax=Moraxella marmotae TaxID=3344520 RepID=UPI0035F2A313